MTTFNILKALIIIFIFISVIGYILFLVWYNKNYITKESNKTHDKGWNKCWNCKKVEPTMFFTDTFFGRIYKCKECSLKKNK